MDNHSRIDEMRRRVEKDPASIAFASLAEELRKAGEHDEAVRVCRAGLEHHPGYVSAHVTLGRALLELQQYPEARTELEFVLHAAPDNLLALKCMTELQERTGAQPAAPVEAPPEPAPAPSLSFAPAASPSFAPAASPSFAPAPSPSFAPAPSPSFAPTSSLSFATPPPPVESSPEPTPEPPLPAPDPALGELEEWQASIQADRARRSGGSPSR